MEPLEPLEPSQSSESARVTRVIQLQRAMSRRCLIRREWMTNDLPTWPLDFSTNWPIHQNTPYPLEQSQEWVDADHDGRIGFVWEGWNATMVAAWSYEKTLSIATWIWNDTPVYRIRYCWCLHRIVFLNDDFTIAGSIEWDWSCDDDTSFFWKWTVDELCLLVAIIGFCEASFHMSVVCHRVVSWITIRMSS